MGLQPTGLANEAWKVLKLISAYAAKKKLEISGAIALRFPGTTKLKSKYILLYRKKFRPVVHPFISISEHVWKMVEKIALAKPTDGEIRVAI